MIFYLTVGCLLAFVGGSVCMSGADPFATTSDHWAYALALGAVFVGGLMIGAAVL